MFDLSTMSESDLINLNKAVVARINSLRTVKAVAAASQFRIGQLVNFRSGKSPFSPVVTAKINTINTKSITVTDVNTGKGWRVAPNLLTAVAQAAA